MSVIKEEYMQDRITRSDLLPLSFLKKSVYTGSRGSLRYRIAKIEEGEGEEIVKKLRVFTWTTPFAFDKTPEEEMTVKDYAFSEDSLDGIAAYLNSAYEETVKS